VGKGCRQGSWGSRVPACAPTTAVYYIIYVISLYVCVSRSRRAGLCRRAAAAAVRRNFFPTTVRPPRNVDIRVRAPYHNARTRSVLTTTTTTTTPLPPPETRTPLPSHDTIIYDIGYTRATANHLPVLYNIIYYYCIRYKPLYNYTLTYTHSHKHVYLSQHMHTRVLN